LSRDPFAASRRRFPVKNNARSTKITVSADGRGLVSQARAVLLWETLRVTGLGRGLSAGWSRWRAPREVHDPGKGKESASSGTSGPERAGNPFRS
jgi:hypothetical protein